MSPAQPPRFPDSAAVEAALAATSFLVFKHSLICPVSAAAFREYQAFVAEHPDVQTAWIDVIGERPWSQRVATATGVRHESPQALLIRDGRVAWHASHGAVTQRALATATHP